MAFNNDLDRSGRFKKVYRGHLDPAQTWRDEHFVSKYRLSKARLQEIANDFGPWSRTEGTDIGGGQSHFQQVCLAVRYLATGANYSTVAETQRVSNATVSRCVEDLTNYFYDTSNRYICWPYTMEQKMAKARGFYHKHGKRPMIMGCVDGTHVAIISPSRDREAVFTNRKGYYSLNCMVVCDTDNIITHIDTVRAGSANDAYVFSTSELYDEAEAPGGWGGFALLGDSGYPLKDYLLTPYHNPATARQRAYNRWHLSTRSLVERTIGLMKQRWRCLDASGGYLYHVPERASKIVVACACLHNLAVMDRVPHLDARDNGNDRFVQRRPPPEQPQDHHQADAAQEDEDARDDYARIHFRNFPAV